MRSDTSELCTSPVVYHIAISAFFFNATATTEIYTLSLHDALPISTSPRCASAGRRRRRNPRRRVCSTPAPYTTRCRSEEHTSELQSRQYLVCRLLLEKKKKRQNEKLNTNRTMTHATSRYVAPIHEI